MEKKIADAAKGLLPPPPPAETPHPEENEVAQKHRGRSAKPSSRGSEARDVDMRDSVPGPSNSPRAKAADKVKPKLETPVPLPEKYRQSTQFAGPKPSPAPLVSETPTETPNRGVESDSPVERLLAVLSEIAQEHDVKKVRPKTIHSNVYYKCRIREYGGSREVLAYYAKELLPGLGPQWKGTPFHDWLEEAAKQPFEPMYTKIEEIPSQTARRMRAAPKTALPNAPASQLPPAIALRTKVKKATAIESDGDSDGDVAPPVRGRKSGKGAVLRLASGSKKRPAPDSDGQESGSRRGRKSAKFFQHASDEDEEDEDAEDASNDEAVGDEEAAGGSRLPLPEGAVRVVVHAERIPTMSPKGPNGTWTCEQEGCSYVVRSADEEAAQELIREHFRDHDAQAEKISLALKESRGHMPIKYAYFPPILLLVRERKSSVPVQREHRQGEGSSRRAVH